MDPNYQNNVDIGLQNHEEPGWIGQRRRHEEKERAKNVASADVEERTQGLMITLGVRVSERRSKTSTISELYESIIDYKVRISSVTDHF